MFHYINKKGIVDGRNFLRRLRGVGSPKVYCVWPASCFSWDCKKQPTISHSAIHCLLSREPIFSSSKEMIPTFYKLSRYGNSHPFTSLLGEVSGCMAVPPMDNSSILVTWKQLSLLSSKKDRNCIQNTLENALQHTSSHFYILLGGWIGRQARPAAASRL